MREKNKKRSRVWWSEAFWPTTSNETAILGKCGSANVAAGSNSSNLLQRRSRKHVRNINTNSNEGSAVGDIQSLIFTKYSMFFKLFAKLKKASAF